MTLYERHCALMREGILPMYTLYANARDYPQHLVVRCTHVSKHGPQPAAVGCVYTSVKDAFEDYDVPWLMWMPRDPADEPQILGTWL
jgi:hypothetical protein